jgi:hypothetical protein
MRLKVCDCILLLLKLHLIHTLPWCHFVTDSRKPFF